MDTLEGARLFLLPDIYDKFREKLEEFSTTNRTYYCFDPKYLSFISPKAIDDDKIKCPACHKSTCTISKAETSAQLPRTSHLTALRRRL